MGRPTKDIEALPIDPDPPGAAAQLKVLRRLVKSGGEEACWLYAMERVCQELNERRKSMHHCPPRPCKDPGAALGED